MSLVKVRGIRDMSTVGQREILTQKRVIAFFKDALGYTYLGNWQDRDNNRNVERGTGHSTGSRARGHSRKIIDKVLFDLGKAVALGGSKTLYDVNREVYSLLRYGVKVQPDVGEHTDTVWLIDWKNPGQQRLCHCRGSDCYRREYQATGYCSLCQWYCAGGVGTEALYGLCD